MHHELRGRPADQRRAVCAMIPPQLPTPPPPHHPILDPCCLHPRPPTHPRPFQSQHGLGSREIGSSGPNHAPSTYSPPPPPLALVGRGLSKKRGRGDSIMRVGRGHPICPTPLTRCPRPPPGMESPSLSSHQGALGEGGKGVGLTKRRGGWQVSNRSRWWCVGDNRIKSALRTHIMDHMIVAPLQGLGPVVAETRALKF